MCIIGCGIFFIVFFIDIMTNPLVSVIIPTHNRKDYVVKAIGSALAQTYRNIEILVIDDFSSDGTFELLLELSNQHSQIVPLRNEFNLGPAGTANRGINQSRGEYIAMLDDDDVWCDENKIKKQVIFLEASKEYVLAGGGVIKVNKEGGEILRYLPIEQDKDIRQAILTDNAFAHSTVMFRKYAWEKAGGYQKDLRYFADWDLWLKLGKLGKFYNFQDFFDYYLDQEQNKSRTTHDYGIRRRLLANINLRRRYRHDYPGYSKSVLLCLANYLYSFLPFRAKLRPLLDKVRVSVFGKPPYTYFDNNEL